MTTRAPELPCAALFDGVLAVDTDGAATVCCIDGTLELEVGSVERDEGRGGDLRRLVSGPAHGALRLAHATGRLDALPRCRECVNDCYGRAHPRKVLAWLLAEAGPREVDLALERHAYLRVFARLEAAGFGSHWGAARIPVEQPANFVAALIGNDGPGPALATTPRAAKNLLHFNAKHRRFDPAEWHALRRWFGHGLAGGEAIVAEVREVFPLAAAEAWLRRRAGASHPAVRPAASLPPPKPSASRVWHRPLALPHGAAGDERLIAEVCAGVSTGYEITKIAPMTTAWQRSYRVAPGAPLRFNMLVRGPLKPFAGEVPVTRPEVRVVFRAPGRPGVFVESTASHGHYPGNLYGCTQVVLEWDRFVLPEGQYEVTVYVLGRPGVELCRRRLTAPLIVSDDPKFEARLPPHPPTLSPGRGDGLAEAPLSPNPLSPGRRKGAPDRKTLPWRGRVAGEAGREGGVLRGNEPARAPAIEIDQINLNIAGHCNLACVMCPYVGPEHGKSPRLMAAATPAELLLTAHAQGLRIRNVQLSWKAESLLHPEIERVLDELADPRIAATVDHFSLVTNGLPLRPALSGAILERVREQRLPLKLITFSVDGGDPESYGAIRVGGDFALLRQRIGYFLEKRRDLGLSEPTVVIQAIPQTHNIGKLDEFVATWADLFRAAGVEPLVTDEFFFPRDALFLKPLDTLDEIERQTMLKRTREFLSRWQAGYAPLAAGRAG